MKFDTRNKTFGLIHHNLILNKGRKQHYSVKSCGRHHTVLIMTGRLYTYRVCVQEKQTCNEKGLLGSISLYRTPSLVYHTMVKELPVKSSHLRAVCQQMRWICMTVSVVLRIHQLKLGSIRTTTKVTMKRCCSI